MHIDDFSKTGYYLVAEDSRLRQAQEKEFLCGDRENWNFAPVYSAFTLSIKKNHAPTRAAAEKLIRELIQDCLETNDGASGSVRVVINTDDSVFQRSSGYHIGFLRKITEEQEELINVGMERERKRRKLGSGDRFFVPDLQNASWYIWRQSGSPVVMKIRLRKKNKFC